MIPLEQDDHGDLRGRLRHRSFILFVGDWGKAGGKQRDEKRAIAIPQKNPQERGRNKPQSH